VAAQDWLAARQADLLPVPYYHVVFTLPAPIGDIAYHNKTVVYDLLFKVSAETHSSKLRQTIDIVSARCRIASIYQRLAKVFLICSNLKQDGVPDNHWNGAATLFSSPRATCRRNNWRKIFRRTAGGSPHSARPAKHWPGR
jgi:hypothetical protein